MSGTTLAIVNHKGGVGKTTTTFSLGKALALEGQKVLLVDADPQSNLSQWAGYDEPEQSIYQVLLEDAPLPAYTLEEGLDLLPSDLALSEAELKLQNDVNGYFKLKDALKQAEGYDYVLVDCPPSLGILTINALIAADGLIITVQAEYLAVKGLQTILNLVNKLKENLNPDLAITGLLLTQLNRTVLKNSIADKVRAAYQGKVFRSTIRQTIALAEASAQRQDIFRYQKASGAAEDYRNLAKELLYGTEEL